MVKADEDRELTQVNGIAKHYSAASIALQGIGVAVLIAAILTFGNEWRNIIVFMGQGNRCTAFMCSEMDRRVLLLEERVDQRTQEIRETIGELRTEDRRLQVQIDRIEGTVYRGIRKPPLESYAPN